MAAPRHGGVPNRGGVRHRVGPTSSDHFKRRLTKAVCTSGRHAKVRASLEAVRAVAEEGVAHPSNDHVAGAAGADERFAEFGSEGRGKASRRETVLPSYGREARLDGRWRYAKSCDLRRREGMERDGAPRRGNKAHVTAISRLY